MSAPFRAERLKALRQVAEQAMKRPDMFRQKSVDDATKEIAQKLDIRRNRLRGVGWKASGALLLVGAAALNRWFRKRTEKNETQDNTESDDIKKGDAKHDANQAPEEKELFVPPSNIKAENKHAILSMQDAPNVDIKVELYGREPFSLPFFLAWIKYVDQKFVCNTWEKENKTCLDDLAQFEAKNKTMLEECTADSHQYATCFMTKVTINDVPHTRPTLALRHPTMTYLTQLNPQTGPYTDEDRLVVLWRLSQLYHNTKWSPETKSEIAKVFHRISRETWSQAKRHSAVRPAPGQQNNRSAMPVVISAAALRNLASTKDKPT